MSVDSSKNIALQRWLADSGFVTDLYFNFGNPAVGDTGIETIAGDRVLTRYLDGSAMKVYEFGIVQTRAVNQDTANSEENAEEMDAVEAFMEWITAQNRERNFPNFQGCTVQRMEVLHNRPVAGGVDGEKARYLFTVRITYLEYNKLGG